MVFFFQAEDGIRDRNVTGVQTCALPISRTGVPAATIRQLARDFAGAPAAVCYGRLGSATQDFGALTSWLIQAINIVTGNLDRAGGALFAKPRSEERRVGKGGRARRGGSA